MIRAKKNSNLADMSLGRETNTTKYDVVLPPNTNIKLWDIIELIQWQSLWDYVVEAFDNYGVNSPANNIYITAKKWS